MKGGGKSHIKDSYDSLKCLAGNRKSLWGHLFARRQLLGLHCFACKVNVQFLVNTFM